MADPAALPDLPQLSRTLLAYTIWADTQHLDALAAIPPEHLTVATGTSFGSLLGTMAHVLGSEQVWIGRFVGGGVAAGFVLYVATKFVGDLGGSGVLSPPVAAWSPAIVASMLGALALLNQEDG